MIPIFVPYAAEKPLRDDYARKLKAFGMEILAVPTGANEDVLHHAYRRSQGVLLPGGSDISPVCYNSEPHTFVKDLHLARDQLDLATLEWTAIDKKPVLGICRGAQMMAVYAGLALRQHLPETLDPTTESHSIEVVPQTLAAVTKNEIWIRPSHARGIIGKDTLEVSCAHHQAVIAKPNKYLDFVGFSKARVPEIWEGKDPARFCIGVQFHPEIMYGPSDNLFRALREAAITYGKKTRH